MASARLLESTHEARCMSNRLASTTVGIQALRGRTFVERAATADVRALPPMESGSSSTLNERGAITKDTMCAERFPETCEENTCQVTGVACVPNGVANFETKLVKFGGDTDSDALRGSCSLCSTGPEGFQCGQSTPAVNGLVKRRFRSTFLGTSERRELSVTAMWSQDQRQFRDLLSHFGKHCTLDRRRDWLFLMHVIFFI